MSLTIVSPPRITDDVFVDVLQRAQSPAAEGAATLYAVCVSYGVDPAVALAFFAHESSYGRQGKAVQTRNWGNLRAGPRAYQIAPVGGSGGPFAWYRSWRESLEDFCVLLRGPAYEGAGRTTVATVVPRYAPSSDGNRPAAYIKAVETLVVAWARRDPWDAWGTRFALPPEQRGHGIPRAWFDARPPLGAATSPEWGDGKQAVRFFEGGAIVWLGGDETHIVRRRG